ncbi:ubiquinol-cytochrome c reductase iron-sulfur subunit [Roseateles sp.]|uniref:ubiquinol-cytochrome c reductase iron-sulfur subunit n=1 Tax=Roseateles sp. TaxID=1971397 RepID=UPI002E0B26B8|nr:ubiquinol-cytochrome c reductase iron-sulfur subunit [Roseateles sp.]HEV6965673.1 ubiquinol-cytochrome c reductase iron-sulfur subunit [Roseateles sp.]
MNPSAVLPPLPDPERRTWLLATAGAGGIAAVGAAAPLVASLAPSERARSQGAAVEVDIGDIPAGGMKAVEWRGKPVWILRRTPEMLASLQALAPRLADPGSQRDDLQPALRNVGRSSRPEFLVVIGICTHLGCSPSFTPAGGERPAPDADWPGGFFCPCHGSTFDLAGRVFKNKPAPTNLEVPPHHYLGDARLLIGEPGPT